MMRIRIRERLNDQAVVEVRKLIDFYDILVPLNGTICPNYAPEKDTVNFRPRDAQLQDQVNV